MCGGGLEHPENQMKKCRYNAVMCQDEKYICSDNFIPCVAWFLLLRRGIEFVRIRSALIFDALARWSVDLLQVFLPTGGLSAGPVTSPGDAAHCGCVFVHHKTQAGIFWLSAFASGFFEGKPRGKTNKTKHLRKIDS
jgi:hypothetical protein